MKDHMHKKSPMKLNAANLDAFPQTILRPRYDRAALRAGIVHIGVGNFHRGHQAWYLHRLMQQGLAHDWAIIGAGVRATDATMRDKLLAQDCLTTLIELSTNNSGAEIIGSMIDFLPVEDGNAALIAQLAQADIRIVSLTVTEGGYFIHPATKGFDAAHPDIAHDAANPTTPRTAFGAIVAALKLRKEMGLGAFTALSCDNLVSNGDILRQTVVSLAHLSDPALADWIDNTCSFPNSMVDCIVPATGQNELALAKGFGVDDAAPVTHEDFRQWVIEDHFCAGRPDWDKVGAQFTNDVHAFEAMKIRILNGGHQVISVPAQVLGIDTISGCMEHDLLGPLFLKIAHEEIAPHVDAVPDMTPSAYVKLIQRRCANPMIVDTTRRVAFDGSSRHPGFVLPSIRDGLAAGTSIDGLALIEAAWARMCAGTRGDGAVIAPNDPFWADLNVIALRAKDDPAAWLSMTHIYGDLAENARFVAAFKTALRRIWANGMSAAIQNYLSR
ncbi:MAG: mannitol dehydrogenase family protein [Yoonia sp.]|nr:mannitol dehydrogenase family protein [Yoonia sp.]